MRECTACHVQCKILFVMFFGKQTADLSCDQFTQRTASPTKIREDISARPVHSPVFSKTQIHDSTVCWHFSRSKGSKTQIKTVKTFYRRLVAFLYTRKVFKFRKALDGNFFPCSYTSSLFQRIFPWPFACRLHDKHYKRHMQNTRSFGCAFHKTVKPMAELM